MSSDSSRSNMDYQLNQREHQILTRTIQSYISSAKPVPSKQLVARHNLGISSATVRNIMKKLEDGGYLEHRHTSSGRIPTEHGYRYYVNQLLRSQPEKPKMSLQEQAVLAQLQKIISSDMNQAVVLGAQLLARLSNLLAVITTPELAKARLHKLELVELSHNRLLVVLSVDNGIVKTVTVEVEHQLHHIDLDETARELNERLHDLTFSEIANHIEEVLKDKRSEDKTGIMEVFIDYADTIFDYQPAQRFFYGGVEYMALQPEFSEMSQYRKIVSALEDEQTIIHLLQPTEKQSENEISVRIGREHNLQQIDNCSVVFGNYSMGENYGSIGLLGPQRMDYEKMIALVGRFLDQFNKVQDEK